MAVYLDDFFNNANDRNLDFCKIDIFSETISSGRTYFAISVSRINSRSCLDQFSNMMGYLGKFFQDLCGISIESHWNYQGIQM